MTRAPHRKDAKPTYTANEVAAWIVLMKENQWSLNKLAKHLKMGYGTVQIYLEKLNAGQLE